MTKDDREPSKNSNWSRYLDIERVTVLQPDREHGANRLHIDCDLVMKVAILFIKDIDNIAISRLTGLSKNAVSHYICNQLKIYFNVLLNEYNRDVNVKGKLDKYNIQDYADFNNFTDVYNKILDVKDNPEKRSVVDTKHIKHILSSVGVAKGTKKRPTSLEEYGDINTYIMIKRILEHNGGKVTKETDESWDKLLKTVKDTPKNSLKEFVNFGVELSKAREVYICSKVLQCLCISLGPEEVSKLLMDISDYDELMKSLKVLFDSTSATLLNHYAVLSQTYKTLSYQFNLITFNRLLAQNRGRSNQGLFDSSNQINFISSRVLKIRLKNKHFVDEVFKNYQESIKLINPKKQDDI